MKEIKKGSARAWLLAARPKTLSAAAVPVLAGWSLAYADGGFDIGQRHAIALQGIRLDADLVLLHRAAKAGDIGDAGHHAQRMSGKAGRALRIRQQLQGHMGGQQLAQDL